MMKEVLNIKYLRLNIFSTNLSTKKRLLKRENMTANACLSLLPSDFVEKNHLLRVC